MAKQAGDFFIEGTIDDLTFYKMEGKYYVRMKSSLTGKKFWQHKAFERSRQSCNRFGEGNKLASKLYRMIEEEKRAYKLFCFLKKNAIQLLKKGKSLVDAEEVLVDYLIEFGFINKPILKEDIEAGNCSVACIKTSSFKTNAIIQNVVSKKKNVEMTKITERGYACAVGPPNVIGI